MDGSGPGTGGTGGAGGNTTTTTWTSTTHTVTITETTINTADCATLESDLNSLIEQATTCNSCMNTDSCINGPKIHDTCGCLVGASSMATDIANNAESLYHTWVTQGCGPYQCEQPCFSDNTPYYCTPQGPNCGGSCQPGFGTGG